MRLYHGTYQAQFETHSNQCFTDDYSSAWSYTEGSDNGKVAVIDIPECVDFVEVAGYDRDTDTAEGDSGQLDSNILFADEDIDGNSHDTYRFALAIDPSWITCIIDDRDVEEYEID